MRIAIVILAAGTSTRMRGTDKLLEDIRGVPLLRRMSMNALGACNLVGVTLPEGPLGQARRAVLDDLKDLARLTVTDTDKDMAASVRRGVDHFVTCDALAIVPADMPEITRQDFTTLIDVAQANPARIVRAVDVDGKPGHPVIFPARLFPDLQRLRGDIGAKGVLHGELTLDVSLPDRHATTDLDTPEDWMAWRAARDSFTNW